MTPRDRQLRVLFFEGGYQGGSVWSLAKFMGHLVGHGFGLGLVSFYHHTSPVDLMSLPYLQQARSLDVSPGTRPDVVTRTAGVPHFTFFGLRYLLLSLTMIWRYRPSLVYLNNGPEDHLPAIIAAKLLGIPIICHIRHSEKLTRVDKRCIRYVDQFVVLTEWARRFFQEQGIPLHKSRQMYNPFLRDQFIASADKSSDFRLPSDTINVVQVGKLSAHKRPEMAIEAFGLARAQCPTLRLILVGDGPLKGMVEDLAGRRGLGNSVHLIGYCQQVPSVLSQCHIGLLTSRSEGQSNCVMEYMAAGLPVVTWNMPAIDELVQDGVTGWVAKEESAAAIAEGLTTLYHSSALRARMGKVGQEAVFSDRFAPEPIYTELSALVRALARQ